MKAETWVSSSALLNRMNFALALTGGKIKGVKVDAAQLAGNPAQPPDSGAALSALEAELIVGGVSQQTHDSIAAQIEAAKIEPAKTEASKTEAIKTEAIKNVASQKPDSKAAARKPEPAPKPPDVNTIAGLLLGSPEFQRR
jgi:signal recognition particle GTPase